MVLVCLSLPARADDLHPNDRVVHFFKKPDSAAADRIKEAIEDRFVDNLASERATGRADCLRYPRWSTMHLVALLKKRARSRPIQRWNGVLTLARILDPRAIDALRYQASDDKSSEVQLAACLALGCYRDERFIDDLARVLKTAKAREAVVIPAIFALAKIGGDRVERILLDHLHRSSTGTAKRNAILVALGFFSTKASAEATSRFLKARSQQTRVSALVGRINGAWGTRKERIAELEALFERKRESGEVRALALLALARFENFRGATLRLASALRDRDSEVVRAAAMAFQRRADPRARRALVIRLTDSRQGDAKLIAQLLLALASVARVNPLASDADLLIRKLSAADDAIRVYAAVALARVGDGWDAIPDSKAKAVRALSRLLTGGSPLKRKLKSNLQRALAILDPGHQHAREATEWISPWGDDEDPVLRTLDRDLYSLMLDRTNWAVEDALQIHSLTDRPETRFDLESGTPRAAAADNKPLRDLKLWLLEVPYFDAKDLPDRGYRDE